jgi:hypothetical protein
MERRRPIEDTLEALVEANRDLREQVKRLTSMVEALVQGQVGTGHDRPAQETPPSGSRSHTEVLLEDPRIASMPLERACSAAACRLAEHVFGPEVLRVSNLTGRDGRSALDPAKLDTIKNSVKQHFSGRWRSDEHYETLWRKCREALSSKCKYHRQVRFTEL